MWDEAVAANKELNLFIKKLEADNVKQFLEIDIVRFQNQVCILLLLFTTYTEH